MQKAQHPPAGVLGRKDMMVHSFCTQGSVCSGSSSTG